MKKTKLLGLVTIVAIIVFTIGAILVGQAEANKQSDPKDPRGIKVLESQSYFETSEGGSLSFSDADAEDVKNPTTSRTDKKFSYSTSQATYTGTAHYDLKTKTLTFKTLTATSVEDGSPVALRSFTGSLNGTTFTFEGNSYTLSYSADELYKYPGEQLGEGIGNVFNFLFIVIAAVYYGINLLIFAADYAATMKGKFAVNYVVLVLAIVAIVVELSFAISFSSLAWATFLPINALQIVFFFVAKKEIRGAKANSVQIG